MPSSIESILAPARGYAYELLTNTTQRGTCVICKEDLIPAATCQTARLDGCGHLVGLERFQHWVAKFPISCPCGKHPMLYGPRPQDRAWFKVLLAWICDTHVFRETDLLMNFFLTFQHHYFPSRRFAPRDLCRLWCWYVAAAIILPIGALSLFVGPVVFVYATFFVGCSFHPNPVYMDGIKAFFDHSSGVAPLPKWAEMLVMYSALYVFCVTLCTLFVILAYSIHCTLVSWVLLWA
jgi:hypothetical protein